MLTTFFTIWGFLAVIGIILAVVYWVAEPAYPGTEARERELRVGAIMFLAALFAPLSIVALAIYWFVWLVRTALGK